MRKIGLMAMAALVLSLFGGAGALAQTGGTGTGLGTVTTVTVPIGAENDSGQTGQAVLTDVSGQTRVQLTITAADATTPQPAHIHLGTCANLDPKPLIPLNSVVNGMSDTTVPMSLQQMMNTQVAINVHKSAAQVTTYVACGDVTAAVKLAMAQAGTGTGTGTGGTPGMPTTGAGDQSSWLLALGLLGLTLCTAGLALARRKS